MLTGLYHKAILMGMYAFNPVVLTPPENASIAYEFALTLGYEGKPGDDKRLLNFYKSIDFSDVITARAEQFFSKVKSYR